MKSKRFDDYIAEKLRDPEYAAQYLEAALEDSVEEFVNAIGDVAAVQEGGFSAVASRAKLGRTSMYKSFSRRGNPGIKTVDGILSAMDMRLCVTPVEREDAKCSRA
jgi:probable addiction module antidote protein